jgi:translation initiation factor 5A
MFYNIVLSDVFLGVQMVEKVFAVAKELKVGKYVLVDDIPCRIVNIESSKPGKHGSAKMRITAIGVFNSQKKTLLTPGDADVEVPIIERKSVQIMSVSGNTAQVMDQQTYEIYDMEIPEELVGQAAAGKEAEVMEAMGKRKMERIR